MTKGNNHFEGMFTNYSLSPQQIAVVTGILLDALVVQAVLVDNNQRVEIVLEGSLNDGGKVNTVVNDIYNMKFGEIFNGFTKK
ncbi:hypothetical protein [Alkalicoccobacillus porphyridii]|uniref:Uncharacterized protein n=1 Tax=Alkalicoccobacillus porphyridii TaxID=2597270 RepID=A0A553ZX53_9BACI|nr:hypothetical protein [Alkalicoccobacillus porphyridii]TSB46039.1 hypothetical protein FN960_14160 [Alkalicoccobacillus porphyridii]